MNSIIKERIDKFKAENSDFLDLRWCEIKNLADIPELFELESLKCLSLCGNKLTDVSGLSGLSNLTTLALNRNKLTDISPLLGLTNLKELDLQDNQLTNVSGLLGLAALTILNLSDNQLTNVSSLSGLTALTTLNLNRNQLTDVSSLSNLLNLRQLYFYTDSVYKENYWSFKNPDNNCVALRLQNGDIVRGCSRYSQKEFIEAVTEKYGNLHPYIAWAYREN